MIEHLSYSSITTYLSCSAAWRFRYLDKVPVQTSPELVVGTTFHHVVEENVKGRTEGIYTDMITAWTEEWKRQTETNNISWESAPEVYHNDGVRLLSSRDIQEGILSIKAAVDGDGAKIERKVTLQVPGVPVPVIGYIDVITSDGIPGDFKTSAKSWTSDKAVGEMQPLFYLAALNQAGITVPDYRFRHYVFVKTKTPQFQKIEHTHNLNQIMFMFKVIKNVWQGIERGVFIENPTGWKCSPGYCEYFSLCRGKYG